jgi:2-dehydro-3-deoxygalactonokinase
VIAMSASLIGVDWGSSNARAFLFAADGSLLEQRQSSIGVSQYRGEAGVQALYGWLQDWLKQHPEVPLLLCGMVGSASGWRECPYVAAPAGAEELAGALLRFHHLGRPVAIVPGVVAEQPGDGFRDVMRGEETQIAGLPMVCAKPPALVLTPGTHNKWIRLEQGRIVTLSTFMTGELFALLRQHSLLAPVIADGEWDEASFLAGLDTALCRPDWLHQLFGVRARGVQHVMPPAELGQWLSGLLIGYELSSALAAFDSAKPRRCGVIASPDLLRRYQCALACFDIEAVAVDGAAAAQHGLWRIAQHAGLT